ncbi:MAG: type 4a pilus biogenesis protein PilO [Candidatus Omnitrophica bacterium]|nr:type 4a pilus biogenesis protein PilO [Candidatus Omnitrophota bacterium]
MNIKVNLKPLIPVGVAGVAILLTLGTFILCQSFFKVIAATSKQEAAYVQEAKMARDLLATKKISKIGISLIDQSKIASVLEALKKVAAKNKASLKTLRPPFTAKDEGVFFSKVLFDMRVSASLQNLGNFLTGVRNMPEGLIDVEALHLEPDKANANLVTAKITFVLFVARNYGKK